MVETASEAGTDAPVAAQWVVFRCAECRFGVPLARVTEIIVPQPFTRLPGAGHGVCGLVGVRGRVVTVVDFGVLLGLRAAGALPDHRLLLLDIDGMRIGAAVDEVLEIALSQLIPAAGDGAGSSAWAVVGTGRTDDGTFTALAPEMLAAPLMRS